MMIEHEFWAVLPTVVAYLAGILSGMRLAVALRPRGRRVPRWVARVLDEMEARAS